jgi:hypothetical protein
MRLLPLFAVLALVACGADGPPLKPAKQDGITISGDARFGLTHTSE